MRSFTIIGLTGPSGSGKSTVSRFFKDNGYVVINADEVAHGAFQPGSSCLKQVCGAFGRDILNPDGTLNRQRLARKAFATKDSVRLLNDITHPWVFLQVMKLCREYIDNGNRKILFDAPVLFESNSDIMCDGVVSVIAPREVRIERLIKRDKIKRESVELRLSAQHGDDFYITKSDFVIDGSKTLDEISLDVSNILKSFDKG